MALTVVLWLGAAVVVATLGVVVQLVLSRLGAARGWARHREFERLWLPILIDSEPWAALPDLDPKDAVTCLALWTRLHEVVAGQARDRLNGLGRRIGVDRIARDLLPKTKLRDRLLAVCALGQIRDAQSFEALATLSKGRDLALSLAAARSMVQIDAKRAIPALLPLVADREDWAPSVVDRMLRDAGADVVSEPLVAAALAAPPTHAHRLVRFFGIAHSQAAVPAVRQLIRRVSDVECVTACLKVFTDAGELETVRQYLTHPAWEVRVQAVMAIGRMGTAEDEASLVERLADQEWWVRYRAAHALHELPPADTERFERIAAALTDRYACDMVAHVRAERRAA